MKTTFKEYLIAIGIAMAISLPWALPMLMANYCEELFSPYLAWAGKNFSILCLGWMALELVRGKGPTMGEVSRAIKNLFYGYK